MWVDCRGHPELALILAPANQTERGVSRLDYTIYKSIWFGIFDGKIWIGAGCSQ